MFGDTLRYVINNGNGYKTVSEFKIVGIVDNFEPLINDNSRINVLLSKDRINTEDAELDEYGMSALENYNVWIESNNSEKMDIKISEYNNLMILQGKPIINGKNNMETSEYSWKIEEVSRRMLVKIPIYIFVGMVTLLSVLNIFNTIHNSIILRKREFAELKSLGMSNAQLNKMLFLECIFYGIDSIIYGVLISMVILYVMYIAMVDTEIYIFDIHLKQIAICIIITYFTIFSAMYIAKKKVSNGNIIEEIKNENI